MSVLGAANGAQGGGAHVADADLEGLAGVGTDLELGTGDEPSSSFLPLNSVVSEMRVELLG